MTISPSLCDAIATQFTLAANAHIEGSGIDIMDCYTRTIHLIEGALITASALPSDPSSWLQREPVRKVRLGNC